MASHAFEVHLRWPAEAGTQRSPSGGLTRDNVMEAPGKEPVGGSAPPVFGGDGRRYNPEELMLMSLSECHMLTYLALAEKRELAVLAYEDRATGTLGMGVDGGPGKAGRMSMQEVVLRPRVTVARGSDLAAAQVMHDKAHAHCFMANSVNFPVRHQPEVVESTV